MTNKQSKVTEKKWILAKKEFEYDFKPESSIFLMLVDILLINDNIDIVTEDELSELKSTGFQKYIREIKQIYNEVID